MNGILSILLDGNIMNENQLKLWEPEEPVEDRDSRYEGSFNEVEYWANMKRLVEVGRKALGK